MSREELTKYDAEHQLALPFEDHPDFSPTILCGRCGEVFQNKGSSWTIFGICLPCLEKEIEE